jgi:hypothetical protein
MSGSFADRLSCRRAPLAVALCLLAFLFAVEAKTAWYEPPTGAVSDAQSAKALPAVTPRLVGHHAPSPGPLRSHTPFATLPPETASTPQTIHLSQRIRVARNHPPLLAAAFLSPQHFFRPPPAL